MSTYGQRPGLCVDHHLTKKALSWSGDGRRQRAAPKILLYWDRAAPVGLMNVSQDTQGFSLG